MFLAENIQIPKFLIVSQCFCYFLLKIINWTLIPCMRYFACPLILLFLTAMATRKSFELKLLSLILSAYDKFLLYFRLWTTEVFRKYNFMVFNWLKAVNKHLLNMCSILHVALWVLENRKQTSMFNYKYFWCDFVSASDFLQTCLYYIAVTTHNIKKNMGKNLKVFSW